VNINILFYLCDTKGFLQVMNLIRIIINVARFVIPIGLIVLIITDLTKNVINPNDKEGMKKIVNRIIACIVVFLVPTLISLIVWIIEYATATGTNTMDYTISRCYINANSSCINNISDYLDCNDVSDDEKGNCKKFRECNSYILDNSCNITTEFDDINCSDINKEFSYTKFSK
jgi:hypothetical protein